MSVASVLPPPPIPQANVMPSFCAISAYFRKFSHVHWSCSAFLSSCAGYIACRSRPCFLNQLMRAQGGLVWVPLLAGMAAQWPLYLARYDEILLTSPFAACSRFI